MLKVRGLSGTSGFVLGLVVATAIASAGPLQLLAEEGDPPIVEVEEDLVLDEECPTDEGEGDPCAEAGEEEEVATGGDLEGDLEDELDADVLLDGDNHGKVVSTAAHCPIRGRAHGMLVSKVARDKDTYKTVEDAEQACEEALAELEGSAESTSASSHGGPPPWAGPKDKAEKSGGGPPPWAGPKH